MKTAIETLKAQVKILEEKINHFIRLGMMVELTQDQKDIERDLKVQRDELNNACKVLSKEDEIILCGILLDENYIDIDRLIQKKGYKK